MATQPFQLPVASSTLSTQLSKFHHRSHLTTTSSSPFSSHTDLISLSSTHHHHHNSLQQRRRRPVHLVHVGIEDTEPLFGGGDGNNAAATATELEEDEEEEVEREPTADDLEYIGQIKNVLQTLKKNRDMLYGEVKLTISIEDPRELERRRLLGIDDSDGPSREDLVVALEEVNEGKIPRDPVALRILAEEMATWPNLEVELETYKTKKAKKKSLYAKATDTGIDPEVAAKRLSVDWDSAAEIEDAEISDDSEVPSAVGYGALYLVTAFPVIIGISVVLILFYNSLQ